MENNPVKILAIDDNQDNLVVLKALFSEIFPYAKVTTALSGIEGIEKCLNEKPDLVLLDIVMPIMDGYEVCKIIKANDSIKHIPVVMITAARTDKESRIRALESGADAFLAKPVDESEFTAQVKAMLRIKEAEDRKLDEKEWLEKLVQERTEALEKELAERKKVENALRESEYFFKESQRATFVGSYKTNFCTGFWESSEVLDEIFGINQSYLRSMQGWLDIVHPDDIAMMKDHLMTEVIHQQKQFNKEYRIIRKSDNQTRWVYGLGKPDFDINGNIISLIGTVQDITERKQNEEKIQQSHDLLAKLSKQVPGVIYQYQLYPDGRSCFPYASSGLEDIYEVTPESVQLDATQVFNRLHPEDIQYITESILHSAQTLEPYHSEFRVVLPKQGLRWRMCDALPERLADGGTMWHGIILDITGRKRIEKMQKIIFNISNASLSATNLDYLMAFIKDEIGTLIDTTNFFVAFYDEEADAITLPYYVDKNDRYTSFPAGKTMTAYVIKTGKSCLATSDDIERLESAGTVESIGSKSKVWLGVPLEVKGKVTGAIVVQSYDDINAYSFEDQKMLEFVASQISVAIERKKTEQDLKDALILAQEADRLKSTFLATMSHELRTPLNAVIGFSELISEEIPMDNVIEFAKIIKNSGEHLLEMIEDIFDITVLESGQLKEKKEYFLLTPLLNEIYEMIASEQQKMGKDDITVLFNQLLYDNDLLVFSDPRKLKQVFMNLLKNALKFTNEGFVEFGYHKIPNSAIPFLEFYVKDTGIGIPNESQEIIFEIFRQGDDSHTRNYGGTGIGLSMAKKLTEHLGGKIRVTSKVGEGSTFYFTIPYDKTTGEEPVIAEKVIAKPHANLAGKTILIAEDEDSNFELLEVILTNASATVLRAFDGIEAIKICHSVANIDLILMDLKMPRMTGFEATVEIKKLFPDIPIIAQTAYVMPGDNKKAFEAGCNDYVSKPIKKQALMEKIEKYLGN